MRYTFTFKPASLYLCIDVSIDATCTRRSVHIASVNTHKYIYVYVYRCYLYGPQLYMCTDVYIDATV